jgi:hypothetical protein
LQKRTYFDYTKKGPTKMTYFQMHTDFRVLPYSEKKYPAPLYYTQHVRPVDIMVSAFFFCRSFFAVQGWC